MEKMKRDEKKSSLWGDKKVGVMISSLRRQGKTISVGAAVRHLLLLSLALNVGLLLKLLHCGDMAFRAGEMENRTAEPQDTAAQISKSDGLKPASFSEAQNGGIINLDHGDPTMYEKYWAQTGDRTTTVLSGWQSVSYFSDRKGLCWFLESEFANAITRLHKLVGNAVTENYHIVVGTGSTQLFQAVLFALSPPNGLEPVNVVSAVPYYSSYPLITDFLKSGLYKWGGDANIFDKNKPYIELVTSPNNPDGHSRQSVVAGRGVLVHDLAYYWPQYTPIVSPADHDIMLFTVSKSTGHAGMRIGWALVKNKEIAKKMTKFVEISSIGVSKDSQLRAAKILHFICDGYEKANYLEVGDRFFEHSHKAMAKRWTQLRQAVSKGNLFSLPDFPTQTCSFSNLKFAAQPAFAWLKCEGETEDCESFLREYNILTRGGIHFGGSAKYVRISMLDREDLYDEFIKRLSTINSLNST